jgi:hypothetical protein
MTVAEQKKQFAIELLRFPGEGLRAATTVFGELHPIQGRMQIAELWSRDPEILQLCADLIDEHGEEYFLPTKADVARLIYKKANGANVDSENYAKLMRLFCEVRGFIQKAGTGDGPTTNNTQVNVLVVKDKGTDEQWQGTLVEQQRKLIANASIVQ